MSKSPTNRNVSGSSQNKSSLLSSVKREQVEIDPLETLLVRTAVTDDYYENETSRIKVTDPVEIQAKYFLRNCRYFPPLCDGLHNLTYFLF